MDRAGSTRICGPAAEAITPKLFVEMQEPLATRLCASALSEVVVRLEPAEAARICGPAAEVIAKALNRDTEAIQCEFLAQVLSGVAVRLEPAETARICGPAAKTLAEAFRRETDFIGRWPVAWALAVCRPARARPRPLESADPSPGPSPKHSTVRRMFMPQ